jgi:phosphohistidine phosphatase
MKTLLLMRHAKSSWDDPQLDDHDRPLNPRGQRDAPRMGSWLHRQAFAPDRIVTSTALRARTTAEIVARQCGVEQRITTTPDLYHASADDWRDTIQQLPATDQHVLCVGHNPGLEDFLAASVGRFVRMPTAAIAHLTFDVGQWQDVVGADDATLVDVWSPKGLTAD